ncbi:hypothetical protein O6H91_11G085100 [Diphasiastrum complanatum]|uniref:Uncharacterized protein n=1 Tax=Diphasiastrum complanatum TaxID=34168 RepID=A0ACC2CBH2_DIPCM|nr:hypothetical protein O6H91_Y513900 [Diphasiastrum complanatum]KAJ7253298.1 hypothetical protein O6H91_Y418000 [Diphasiastrum complanatum]KAJ7279864.1 hypothetical protein O6H91_Y373700 [Diphasiastrum complanatum]KAJ7539285.1 hypothetical protein O6H91_11G085100 [Diphasiastrum complanatum]
MLETCFSEHAVQVADVSVSSSTTQNLVTCVYRIKLGDVSRFLTITWCKNKMDQGFIVEMDHALPQHACVVAMNRWLVRDRKMQGCKAFDHEGHRIQVFWDLCSAKYVCGPEPQEHFYILVVCKAKVLLFLGDMVKEACMRIKAKCLEMEAKLLSRQEHIFGRKQFATKAQLSLTGTTHSIMIECHTQVREGEHPHLSIRVDRKTLLRVDQLDWKFRGNQTIWVDGVPLEVFWDVHNWLFNPSVGYAIFMFQTNPFMEKPWLKDVSSCNRISEWADNSAFKEMEEPLSTGGFSLFLYAWKSE